MFFKKIAIAFTVLVTLNGCEPDTTDTEADNAVLLPLKVGNVWNYKAFILDSNGTRLPQELSLQIRVTRDTTISGTTWYAMNSFFDKTKEDHFQNRQDGVGFEYKGTSGTLFRFPAQPNTSYAAPDGGTIQVISANSQVTVAGKTYSCYEYKMADVDNPKFIITNYLTKNVGFVKIIVSADELDVYEGKDGPATIVYELESYLLK